MLSPAGGTATCTILACYNRKSTITACKKLTTFLHFENCYTFTMTFTSFLYCVGSPYTDSKGYKKLGFTIYPAHRMRTYNTGDCPNADLDKHYDGIWKINAKNKAEGLRLEQILHAHFHHQRQKRPNGNFTEWFAVSYENVREYMNSQDFVLCELSIDDINEIHRKSECKPAKDEVAEFDEEKSLIAEQQTIGTQIQTLKEEFFSAFLEMGQLPRRIQTELWDMFECICRTDEKYKGIIQWATGVGKTIAFLMLFMLAADKCKREGRIFRGLLIAPKNDIFDTIINKIIKLSRWGICVCEGHNARLSSLHIPQDKPVLVTATHASLTENDIWDKLPAMFIVHYDEVHRATGNEFYGLLNKKLIEWETRYLTGTSATPKTCNPSQNKKITELFGNPLNVLHKCEIDEAIQEGWIAQPRFGVHVLPNTMNRNSIIHGFVRIIKNSIQSKKERGLWKGGKVIAYLPFRNEVC